MCLLHLLICIYACTLDTRMNSNTGVCVHTQMRYVCVRARANIPSHGQVQSCRPSGVPAR
jgi:hypothetical protein